MGKRRGCLVSIQSSAGRPSVPFIPYVHSCTLAYTFTPIRPSVATYAARPPDHAAFSSSMSAFCFWLSSTDAWLCSCDREARATSLRTSRPFKARTNGTLVRGSPAPTLQAELSFYCLVTIHESTSRFVPCRSQTLIMERPTKFISNWYGSPATERVALEARSRELCVAGSMLSSTSVRNAGY